MNTLTESQILMCKSMIREDPTFIKKANESGRGADYYMIIYLTVVGNLVGQSCMNRNYALLDKISRYQKFIHQAMGNFGNAQKIIAALEEDGEPATYTPRSECPHVEFSPETLRKMVQVCVEYVKLGPHPN